MSKISEIFENKKAFVGFLTAGDPSLDKTEEYIVQMVNAGASMIEIGVPFSDPIAEGATIQNSNVRALSAKGGCTTDMVFDMVERVAEKVRIPFVFRAYMNQVFKYGYDRFFTRCRQAGVKGIIIPDVPTEEMDEVKEYAQKYDVDIISFVSMTSEERIQNIVNKAMGYVYFVPSEASKKDETGVIKDIDIMVKKIKAIRDIPVAVGCGIDNAERAAGMSAVADGIVVRSSLVKLVEKYGENAGSYIYDFVKDIVEALA